MLSYLKKTFSNYKYKKFRKKYPQTFKSWGSLWGINRAWEFVKFKIK